MSKAFKKCVELVEEMLREGYRLQISSAHVERLIKIHVGADRRTVQKYTRLLSEDLGVSLNSDKESFWNLHLQDRH